MKLLTISDRGDLQEAMIDAKLNLMEAGKAAKTLDDELTRVRGAAIEVSKVASFSAQEVVDIENAFLKAGQKLEDVTAKGGSAWAAINYNYKNMLFKVKLQFDTYVKNRPEPKSTT
jgi:hypothetical protein